MTKYLCHNMMTNSAGLCSKIPYHIIPAKPLHNHDIVSVHFNLFFCTDICDKLRMDLAMFNYIYLNVDEC